MHETFMQGVGLYEEANKLREQDRFAEAEKFYLQARQLLAGHLDVFVFYDMALTYDFAGDTVKATQCFEQSVQAYEKFKAENPSDCRIFEWHGFITGVQEQLRLRMIATESKSHYLEAIKAVPFAKEQFPLRIYIESSTELGFDQSLRTVIEASVDTWMQELAPLSWLPSLDKKTAGIVISRVINTNPETQSYGGQTTFVYTDDSDQANTKIASAKIAIFSAKFSLEPHALGPFHSLILHELGHALGLDGHSPHATDLMYWKAKRTDLAARDKTSIKLLYD